MTKRTLTLVAYDVSDNQRRSRVLKAVKAFGLDGQKSVHECALSSVERRELEARLRAALEEESDKLMFVRLDPRSVVRTLRENKSVSLPNFYYLG